MPTPVKQAPATVYYHSADYDGLFCKAIAAHYLPADTIFIGWDFSDPVQAFPSEGTVYVLDLPVDRVFGGAFEQPQVVWPAGMHWPAVLERLVWIDHHATSIATHPVDIPGYRIDGVAACRLTWQWFLQQQRKAAGMIWLLPDKKQFIDRLVSEPAAVRLAGEYDVWDKRDPNAEVFQHGLRSQPLDATDWAALLSDCLLTNQLLAQGGCVQYAQTQGAAFVIGRSGYDLQWHGLSWLACNTAHCNSHLFASAVKPHHDAVLGYGRRSNGTWAVSLYGVAHRPDLDLSIIAKAHGGGGHKQACGFTTAKAPTFLF